MYLNTRLPAIAVSIRDFLQLLTDLSNFRATKGGVNNYQQTDLA